MQNKNNTINRSLPWMLPRLPSSINSEQNDIKRLTRSQNYLIEKELCLQRLRNDVLKDMCRLFFSKFG